MAGAYMVCEVLVLSEAMLRPANTTVTNRLGKAIFHIPGSDLVYVTNPKVACSNVKWSLVSAYAPDTMETIQSIHAIGQTPFAKDPAQTIPLLSSRSKTIFSIVRHPRKRFVSAYFDKLVSPKNPTGQRIAISLGLDETKRHRPKVVLDRLLQQSRQDMNPHVAPQIVNLFWGSIPYTDVFRLERLKRSDGVLDFAEMQLPFLDKSVHSTSAKVDMGLFGDEEFEMIDQLYKDDYEAFGYHPDHSAEVSAKIETIPFDSFLLDLVAARRPVQFIAERFGNSAPTLNFMETGAVIDQITLRSRWNAVSPRLLEMLIIRNAMRDDENIARFRHVFPGLAEVATAG